MQQHKAAEALQRKPFREPRLSAGLFLLTRAPGHAYDSVMFTGIVEATCKVESAAPSGGGLTLALDLSGLEGELTLGESISVNGVCLTVSALDGSTATQWTVTLNWLHGLTRGTGPHTFEVQAKRSAGTAANVNIFEPSQGLTQQTGNGATSGGLTAA